MVGALLQQRHAPGLDGTLRQPGTSGGCSRRSPLEAGAAVRARRRAAASHSFICGFERAQMRAASVRTLAFGPEETGH